MKENKKICICCGREMTSNYITGQYGYICGDCVENIVNIDKISSDVKQVKKEKLPTPQEIKDHLDQYIIGQEEAKMVMATAVYNHYKRILQDEDDVEIEHSNILLLGSTGSGKTAIARAIAKFLDVPFTIADCTVLTQAGYVGEDIESVITRLLQNCDYDVDKAECGIIFLDEIDKIARKGDNPSITRDVSGEGVQQGLLKLIEGTDALVPPNGGRKHPDQKMVKVNTKNILFIGAGAFDGIEDRIKSRMNKRTIGYNTYTENDKISDEEILSHVTQSDLKKFGLIPEIIGRLPIITHTNPLDEKALVKILVEPKNSLVSQYTKLMCMDGVKIRFTKSALQAIAKKAMETKVGARGLRAIMEKVMLQYMYNAPNLDKKDIVIDKSYVEKKIGKS